MKHNASSCKLCYKAYINGQTKLSASLSECWAIHLNFTIPISETVINTIMVKRL